MSLDLSSGTSSESAHNRTLGGRQLLNVIVPMVCLVNLKSDKGLVMEGHGSVCLHDDMWHLETT